jgi:hypothetical protein
VSKIRPRRSLSHLGHEVLLILATIAVVSIASFSISEVTLRIYPPRKWCRLKHSNDWLGITLTARYLFFFWRRTCRSKLRDLY